jgi:alkanesulfonate monooxygenase SsuD/methylene tetrahydromethanopterin reductase-like flavin-dependent oxidoreductase (luciferase family)
LYEKLYQLPVADLNEADRVGASIVGAGAQIAREMLEDRAADEAGVRVVEKFHQPLAAKYLTGLRRAGQLL